MTNLAEPTSFDDLWNAAQSGDVAAQYGLAAYYGQRGRARRALRWLQAAAEGGNADGLYTLACWNLQGLHVAPDWEHGCALLDRAADQGHADALCSRAVIRLVAEGEPAWKGSLADIADAASQGHAAAMRQIGMLAHSMGHVDEARKYFTAAAHRGDGAAAWLLKLAAGAGASGEFGEFCRLAPGQPVAPPDRPSDSDELDNAVSPDSGNPDALKGLCKRLGKMAEQPIPSVEARCKTPGISICRKFMSPLECAYLIALSLPRLATSQVFDPTTGRSFRDPYRNSSDTRFWPLEQDLVVYLLNRRIAQLAGLPIENQEMLTVLRYEPGQEYKPHYDFLTDKAELASHGQRVKTVLIYLNDDFEGGETNFLKADVSFKGGTGDALIFDNVDKDGKPDQRTLHAGEPISNGIKWLASKWIRDGRQPLIGRQG